MVPRDSLNMDKHIHILQFVSGTKPAGTELILYNLIQNTNRDVFKHDFMVLTDDGGPMPERYERLGSRVVQLHWTERINKIAVLVDVRRELRKGGYDLIIAYGLRANLLARLAGIGLPLKVVGGLRSLYSSDKPSQLLDILDRATFSLCEGYISNSKTAIERYARLGFSSEKFFLVRNGIDTGRFNPDKSGRNAKRLELGIAPDVIVIISVANLRPVKNHPMQLRAIRALSDKNVNALLLLAGEGSERAAVEKQASELGLKDRVRLLGGRDDIPELLAASDIFLLTSKWEGVSNSILEAMGSGIPVVSTCVGCIHEVVSDGEEGFLAPPDDDNLIVERLFQLCANIELRRAMGERGRKRVVENHSLQRRSADFESVCMRILGYEK